MATIKEIADRLGISVSTVSKGLNGASDISENLRRQVLDAAVEMGYSTKRSRKEEHRKLCLMVENMDYESPDDFGYNIILGFRQNAFRHKWDVDVVPATQLLELSEKYDNYMLRHGYSGAFLMGFSLEDSWIEDLKTTTVPTVLLDNFIPDNPHVCYLGTDSYEGIDLAVRHLYDLGHRKIAFLNGSPHSMISENRQLAYETALAGAGLSLDPKLTAFGHYVPETAPYHVPGFLANGATAILCGNDLIAKGVLEECRRLGRKVPEEISVVGFDDIPLAQQLTPPLTTVRQDRNQLGQCAYMSLSSLIQKIPLSRTQLRPELILRSSTAPCLTADRSIPEETLSAAPAEVSL